VLLGLLSGCELRVSEPAKVLNPEHRVVIEDCSISYNERPLRLGSDIQEWVAVLGPYDRLAKIASDVYVWDELALSVYTETDRTRVVQMNFYFTYDSPFEQTDQERYEQEKDPIRKEFALAVMHSKPRQLFEGAIAVDGVLIDRQIDIKAINRERAEVVRQRGGLLSSPDMRYFGKSYVPSEYAFERRCHGLSYVYILQLDFDDYSKLFRFDIAWINRDKSRP
jgi:hypothetical protein